MIETMATVILSDTWPNENYTKWNHPKMLEWILHLNTRFSQQYNGEFSMLKVNGQDFPLLSDIDYLECVLNMNQQHAAAFSNILITRMDNYANNNNQKQSHNLQQSNNNSNNHNNRNIHNNSNNYNNRINQQYDEEIKLNHMNNSLSKARSDSIQQIQLKPQQQHKQQQQRHQQKPLQNNAGMVIDTKRASNIHNVPKQEYTFSSNQPPPLQTQNSDHTQDLPASLQSSPLKAMSPELQPIQPIIINQPFHLNTYPNDNGNILNNESKSIYDDFADGPPLPQSRVNSVFPQRNNDINNNENKKDLIIDDINDMDSDDDMYKEHGNMQKTPHTPKTPQNNPELYQKIGSAYDTLQARGEILDDTSMEEDSDDQMYKKYKTKGGYRVEQSVSTQIDFEAVLSDIEQDELKENILMDNHLVEIHKNNRGIAQLLISNNENDFKQLDIQLNECKRIWRKQRKLDANIQFIQNNNNNGNNNNNINNIKLITLQCLRKLEELLVDIGGQEATAMFFNINCEISQRMLQRILTSAHTNNIGHSQINKYEIFSKLKNAPLVSNKHTQRTDYGVMISINFDIQYTLIIQNENKNKQILMNELSIILEIDKSFIEIISSGPGNGSCWHLNIKIEMWSYLYSLKDENVNNNNMRERNILNYQFATGDHIDVQKNNKWYLCKIKAMTVEAKFLATKGNKIRIGYIGKYVERNGQIIKEMGKPFKLKNTEWIWTHADKDRIRIKQLNVTEAMTNKFLKIGFRG